MPLDPSIPADADILLRLRRYIAEPTPTTYTDQILSDMYDAAGGDINVTAADVWREKASKAASLVDTSEGASSRKMSQVMSNALKQAQYYGGGDQAATPVITRGATTRAIERI